jgi:tetratricopeptide (TPR) repeat protein
MHAVRCFACLFLGLWTSQFLRAQTLPPSNQSSRSLANRTRTQLAALEALDSGVEEFRNGQTERAIEDFKDAKRLDPNLLDARLYLATSYAAQYIPGDSSNPAHESGELAVAEFRDVLALDPGNLSALDALGALRFQMAGSPFRRDLLLESKDYFQKHISLKPADPEPYFWIGVINWTLAFRANRELRTSFHLDETEVFPLSIREQYASEYGAIIDEGIDSMNKAMALRPDYDDAMAYLNLLYRLKADVVDSEVAREELVNRADDLIDKVKEIKQKRAKPESQPEVEQQP